MKKLFFFHPFLFAFFPAIFLYAYNINHFAENVLIIPMFLSLGTAAIIYFLSLLIIRKPEISAIISSYLILVFFSYSRLNVFFHSDKISFAGIFISFGFVVFLISRYSHHLKKINEALSVFALVLMITALVNVLSSEIKLGRISLPDLDHETDQLSGAISRETPDIYYFILDRYGGDQTLKDYGFDNSPFINFLKSKGFYIASDSTSNYPKTFLSIGSTLNMEYLDFLTQKTHGGAGSDDALVTPMVKNNKVTQFLKDKGYFYVHVGSGWDPTRLNPNADRNFVMSGGRYPFADEFTSGFLQTTIISPLLKKLYPDNTAVSVNPKNNDHRSRIIYEFSVFDQIPQIDEPKFVFTHILAPHDPFVLGKDCEPLTEITVASRKSTENYLNQLQCTNIKTEEVIKKILENSKTKPIIIIQADEGPLPMVNKISDDLNWKDAADASLAEKFPILNAYLLPDLKKNPIYPSITPVNSFRVIFNSYFDTNLPLLPDRNIIFENDKNYYKFIDVTDRLKDKLQ